MAWTAVYGNGYYYGTTITIEQIQGNVQMIYYYFKNKGWNDYPIAAMLGNMRYEGELNPGQWQHGHAVEEMPAEGVGFGLVQWTPWTKYTLWAENYGDWRTNWNLQLDRIQWECDNNQQWVQRHGYTLTFKQFTESASTDIDWLTMAWFWCYEYGTPLEAQRKAAAREWLAYIQTLPPGPGPGPTPSTRRHMPIWMMLKPWYRRF